MLRRLILSLTLLCCFAASARAADIYSSVNGFAGFPPSTDLVSSPIVTPDGGLAFDFHEFGQGGGPCTEDTGEPNWLCASASAAVEFDRRQVATSTYVGIA